MGKIYNMNFETRDASVLHQFSPISTYFWFSIWSTRPVQLFSSASLSVSIATFGTQIQSDTLESCIIHPSSIHHYENAETHVYQTTFMTRAMLVGLRDENMLFGSVNLQLLNSSFFGNVSKAEMYAWSLHLNPPANMFDFPESLSFDCQHSIISTTHVTLWFNSSFMESSNAKSLHVWFCLATEQPFDIIGKITAEYLVWDAIGATAVPHVDEFDSHRTLHNEMELLFSLGISDAFLSISKVTIPVRWIGEDNLTLNAIRIAQLKGGYKSMIPGTGSLPPSHDPASYQTSHEDQYWLSFVIGGIAVAAILCIWVKYKSSQDEQQEEARRRRTISRLYQRQLHPEFRSLLFE
eukprot:TRINITY_DN41898_c0_g1_i2.p1 TRINITY_DN41898_c0_g1~~TRINITY_DN41898_c0_g1_i2.p1  ORF type:complete len:351 (-),score=69.57 TRINITY_DN41898_c0_g1_i2:35-1087(-)